MRAILLAAGEGARLRPYTDDRPKCLVELAGRPLLAWQLAALRAAGVEDVTAVTGYRSERVEALGLPTRHNPDYATTNMVATLMCAEDLLDGGDDVLVAYTDLVYEPGIVEALLACDRPIATTVDLEWLRLWRVRSNDPLADAETLRRNDEGDILELGRRPTSLDEIEAQYMGLVKIAAEAAPEVVRVYRGLDPSREIDSRPPARMFMTSLLQHLIDLGHAVHGVAVSGGWLEVDTVEDLETYESLLAEGRLAELCDLDAIAPNGGMR